MITVSHVQQEDHNGHTVAAGTSRPVVSTSSFASHSASSDTSTADKIMIKDFHVDGSSRPIIKTIATKYAFTYHVPSPTPMTLTTNNKLFRLILYVIGITMQNTCSDDGREFPVSSCCDPQGSTLRSYTNFYTKMNVLLVLQHLAP